jgi:hypothetical protein
MELRRVARPGSAFVLTAQQPFTWKLCASNPRALKHELIWEKPNGTNQPLLISGEAFK